MSDQSIKERNSKLRGSCYLSKFPEPWTHKTLLVPVNRDSTIGLFIICVFVNYIFSSQFSFVELTAWDKCLAPDGEKA